MIVNDNPSTAADSAHQSSTFVSIGECMAELAPAAAPQEFKLGFAGDTLNTAWYVHQLQPDMCTRYVTKVGCDAMSDAMVSMFEDVGIDTGSVMRSPDRTVGLYLIRLTDGERSFSYWRDNSAARLLAEDRSALDGGMADADTIYFSGITLAILNTKGRENLLGAISDARKAGKTTAFDSNLRPRLWNSSHEMTSAIMDAASVSDVVLPSFDDEANHFDDQSPQATRERYLGAGAQTVVVKNGAGEIHYAHNGQTGSTSPDSVADIVDTTAAGDSFNAGFLVGMQHDLPTAEAIQFASKVAGYVIGHKGALVELPSKLRSLATA